MHGSIDPVDYALHHELGEYLCTYREHSYDNPAASLFAETYRQIRNGKTSLTDSLHSIYQSLLNVTNGVNRTRCELLQTKHFRNPYYSDYNVVIDISKQILRGQSLEFSKDSEWNGFLFDVSMLFEYFIRKRIIRSIPNITLRSKSEHKNIVSGSKSSAVTENGKRKLIPDLVFSHTDGGLFIFDVKYKCFSFDYGISREDLFQLHTYIGQWGNEIEHGIKGCGFIYPLKTERLNNCPNAKEEYTGSDHRYASQYAPDNILPNDCLIYKGMIQQQGKNIPFFIFFLTIPEDSSAQSFSWQMKANCEFFSSVMAQLLEDGSREATEDGWHVFKVKCR